MIPEFLRKLDSSQMSAVQKIAKEYSVDPQQLFDEIDNALFMAHTAIAYERTEDLKNPRKRIQKISEDVSAIISTLQDPKIKNYITRYTEVQLAQKLLDDEDSDYYIIAAQDETLRKHIAHLHNLSTYLKATAEAIPVKKGGRKLETRERYAMFHAFILYLAKDYWQDLLKKEINKSTRNRGFARFLDLTTKLAFTKPRNTIKSSQIINAIDKTNAWLAFNST